MWLHNFLPTDLKGRVRIMIYGYNTALQYSSSRSTSGIADFANDLIVRLNIARGPVSSPNTRMSLGANIFSLVDANDY